MKIFVLFLFFAYIKAEKLKVEIYIESECKYSKKFIQEQIFPFYDELKEKVDLIFIPFGKSRSVLKNSKIEFKCQHGPPECLNNMIMSCVLDSIPDNKNLQMKFIACSMGYEKTKIHCAKEVGFSEDKVKNCLTNGEGIKLQLEAEKITEPIVKASGHVPTIVFNGNYDETENIQAVVNFLNAVERKLIGNL